MSSGWPLQPTGLVLEASRMMMNPERKSTVLHRLDLVLTAGLVVAAVAASSYVVSVVIW